MYSVSNLLLRHDVTAEDLGIVEARKITPDDICGSVADDPEVAAATARWDRATPETYRELVRARLAAQERRGILGAGAEIPGITITLGMEIGDVGADRSEGRQSPWRGLAIARMVFGPPEWRREGQSCC